jgi:hypothetical protein
LRSAAINSFYSAVSSFTFLYSASAYLARSFASASLASSMSFSFIASTSFFAVLCRIYGIDFLINDFTPSAHGVLFSQVSSV